MHMLILHKQVCAPCPRTNNNCCLRTNDCLDIHFMPIMRWVAAGKAVLENTVCQQLSFTTPIHSDANPSHPRHHQPERMSCYTGQRRNSMWRPTRHCASGGSCTGVLQVGLLVLTMHVAEYTLLQPLNADRRCCKRTAHSGLVSMSCRSARRTMLHLSGLSNISMETDQHWGWPGQLSYQFQMCHLRPHSHSSSLEASVFMYELILP